MHPYVGRLAAIYAALAVAVLASGAATYAILQTKPIQHRVARIEKQLGDTDVGRAALAYVTAAASQSGYGVRQAKVLKVVQHGADAQVFVRVTLTGSGGGQTLVVEVGMHEGAWQPTGIQVVG